MSEEAIDQYPDFSGDNRMDDGNISMELAESLMKELKTAKTRNQELHRLFQKARQDFLNQIEALQAQLEASTSELKDTREELKKTTAELQNTRAELAPLKEYDAELQETREKLRESNAELVHARMALEEKEAELEGMRVVVEQTAAENKQLRQVSCMNTLLISLLTLGFLDTGKHPCNAHEYPGETIFKKGEL